MRTLINSDSHELHAMAMVQEYKEAQREVVDSEARKNEFKTEAEEKPLWLLPWEIETHPAVKRWQRALAVRRDIENYLRTIPCLTPRDWQLGFGY